MRLFRRRRDDEEVLAPAGEDREPVVEPETADQDSGTTVEPAAAAAVATEPTEPAPPEHEREWVFRDFDADVTPAAGTAPSDAETRPGDLAVGLTRSRGGFMSRLREFLVTDADELDWDDVEEQLIAGDVGASLAMEIVERARRRRDRDGSEAAVRAELRALLAERDHDWRFRPAAEGGPAVVLVVGVNGTGKTTTIGKLAARARGAARRAVV